MFNNISYAAFLDANIMVKVIDVAKEKSDILSKYYKISSNGELPNALLVSPEARAKIFMFHENENFNQTVWSIIENIVTSSARDELIKSIIKSYGVIYFIEGNNIKENKKAYKKVENAIEEIKLVMMSLPKPAQIPPSIITIKSNDTESEDVLLWSLGWKKNDINNPAVALIYGRGRRMGPILKGKNISVDVIKNMLRFIGEDCECGLDRSWMLGTMIPLRWDSKLQAGVLSQYGFDADNPMVISEMSQILSIAPERVNNSIDTDLLYGYSESVLTISDSTKIENLEQPEINKESSFGFQEAFYTILVICFVMLIIGAAVFVRPRRRKI